MCSWASTACTRSTGRTRGGSSENNPDLFDGPTALIYNRQTAVAVRYGSRYLIWFDAGLGYPSNGVWFDFGKPDVDGYPTVGTISGMNVGGIAPLRGPQDTGNFAWADALVDRVSLFGGINLSGLPSVIGLGYAHHHDGAWQGGLLRRCVER